MSRNTDYFPQNPTDLPEMFSNPLSVWFPKARGLCMNEVQADSCEPSSIRPRLPMVFVARPRPDNSCGETPLRCFYCGLEGTHQNVCAGPFTVLQPVCRGPGAPVTCSPRPLPGLDPQDPASFTSEFLLQSRSYFYFSICLPFLHLLINK